MSDFPEGRFLACAPGFYEPAIYRPKRTIPVVGIVGPPATVRIGEYETRVPTVRVENVKQWPRQRPGPVFYGDPDEPWPEAWDDPLRPWYPCGVTLDC